MRLRFLSVLILSLIFFVFAAGCIYEPITPGSPSQYELPGINNTTIIYLNISTMQIIENFHDVEIARVITGESAESNILNPVAVDQTGENISFNVTRDRGPGKNYAVFNFSSNFSGFIAFTALNGQDLLYPLTKNVSVKIILPLNYTAGSMFLGVMLPAPDNISQDAVGREVLFWKNPYPDNKQIRVKYQHKSTSDILFIFVLSLLLCAVIVTGYYYLTLLSLKKKRM